VKRFLFFLVVLSLCVGWGCGGGTEVQPAFYHWKTAFEPGDLARDALRELEVKRLYLRFFDVDVAPGGGQPHPLARVKFNTSLPKGVEMVPCIFVTNRTFKSISDGKVIDLVEQVHSLLLDILNAGKIPFPKEVQIDCDWTPSTRDLYFSFLESLRERLKQDGCNLSATIRLHQYKYPDQTGVPEVDRGMLMVYNVGNLDDPDEENSIFDLETVRSYLDTPRPYSLSLDVAMPIFGWGVLIRNGKPIRLLNNLQMAHVKEDSLIEVIGPNRVEVLQSHYFRERYLYTGDVIRLEAVSSATLLEGGNLIASQLPAVPKRNIALYHLDSLTLEHYAFDTLQAVFRSFD